MEKKISVLGCLTLAASAVFLLGEIFSVALICYGANHLNTGAFDLGNLFIPVWMLDPIPLCLSVIGCKKEDQHKKIYRSVILVTAIAWLIGVELIARYY